MNVQRKARGLSHSRDDTRAGRYSRGEMPVANVNMDHLRPGLLNCLEPFTEAGKISREQRG